MKEVDVVVIGAGPAGSATALALSRRNVSTLLIDRGDERTRVGEILAPDIQKTLRALGLWQPFIAANHSPSFGMRVRWGRRAPFENDFILNPYGHGWHIDRSRFDALLTAAARAAGAQVLSPAKLQALTSNPDSTWRAVVRCATGVEQAYLARFVVDATGRSASLSRRLGGDRLIYDRMVGVAAFYAPDARCRARTLVRQRQTLIEAVENGWWYSALQPDGRVIVIYMTDADLDVQGLRRDRSRWPLELAKTTDIAKRVAAHTMISAPTVVPAFSSRRSTIAGTSWLAVGDAAAAFDPLSAQGISRALLSAQRAAPAIERFLVGDFAALHDYGRSAEHSFDTYLRLRRKYYAREQRWRHAEFWQRRHGVVDLTPDHRPRTGRGPPLGSGRIHGPLDSST